MPGFACGRTIMEKPVLMHDLFGMFPENRAF